MLDVGWSEMLVIAIILIVVVGPKDLPQMLRSFGRMTAKMRGMANDFQKQFNEALKEAELEDVKKSVDSLRGLNPAAEIRKQLNPFEKAAADVKTGLDEAVKPKATPVPEVKPSEAKPSGAEAPFPAMTDASAPPVQAASDADGKPASSGRKTPAKAEPAKTAAAKTVQAKAVKTGSAATKPATRKTAAGTTRKTTRTPK